MPMPSFVAASDDAAVVIGEHDHGPVFKLRLEHPLAGSIKVVNVY
jgi:hypothetical protein